MNDLDWMNELDLSGLGEKSLEKLMEGLNISALKNSELDALREIVEHGQYNAILKMLRWNVVTAARDPDRVILNYGRNTYEIHTTPGGNLHIQAKSDEGPLGQGVGDSAIVTSIINDLQRRFGDKAAGPWGNTTNPLGRDPYGPIRLHLIGPDGAPVDKITCSLSKWSADNIGEFINEDWELKEDLEVTCVAFSGNILTFCISNGEELQVWLPVGGLRMMIGAHVKSFKIRLYCY